MQRFAKKVQRDAANDDIGQPECREGMEKASFTQSFAKRKSRVVGHEPEQT